MNPDTVQVMVRVVAVGVVTCRFLNGPDDKRFWDIYIITLFFLTINSNIHCLHQSVSLQKIWGSYDSSTLVLSFVSIE